MTPSRDPVDLIPLTPRTFHILLALADGPENGYRVMTLVEENSKGRVRIGPGTLYEALHRLTQRGLIAETAKGVKGRSDGRGQRFYRCTPFGQRVLRAEAERLSSDLELVQGRWGVVG